MNLYYALTRYHLLCVTLHKMLYNNEKGVLLLSDLSPEYQEVKKHLCQSKVFEDVIIFPDKKILNECKERKRTNLEIAKLVEENNKGVEENISISLNSFSAFYICADHFPLGLFMVTNRMRYNYFEDGCGQQSIVMDTINTMSDEGLKFLCQYFNLFGRNENVIHRYIDMDTQKVGYTDDSAIDFSVMRILNQLTAKQKRKICTIFDIDIPYIDGNDSALFLPQHNVNLGVFTTEQQLYQSSLLLDYFAENKKVYIKPHPNDIFTNYSLLGDVRLINGKFPVELLSMFVKKRFCKGITAWSTSINSLCNIIDSKICFTSKIDNYYPFIHRYYAALRMLQSCSMMYHKILCFGVNRSLLENLMLFSDSFQFESMEIIEIENENELEKYADEEDYVCVIDDISDLDYTIRDEYEKFWINQKKKSVSIFINTQNDYAFYNGRNLGVFEYIAMWVIHKELKHDVSIYNQIDMEDERVFAFMTDEKDLNKIRNEGYIKELPYSKMVTKVNLEDDGYVLPSKTVVYRNIKMMEGILIATEQRVLYENNKNQKLMEAYEKLESKLHDTEECIKSMHKNEEDAASEAAGQIKAVEKEISAGSVELELMQKKLQLLEQQAEIKRLREKMDGILQEENEEKCIENQD